MISQAIFDAIIYSLIAFSIVFMVLFGLTLVIYAMRFMGGEEKPAALSEVKPAPAAPAPAAKPAPAPAPTVANVKARHVAAITGAILAMTQGRGRIRSVMPAATGQSLPGTTNRWRTAGIVENNPRGVEPVWKR